VFDLAIRNGTIVDGKGNRAFKSDIYVLDGCVAKVAKGESLPARENIDACGLVVSPGFIDSHCHDDFVFATDPYNMPKLYQGVTTVVVGHCGMGAAVAPDNAGELYEYEAGVLGRVPANPPTTLQGYLSFVERSAPAMNVGVLVGHIPLRVAMTGFEGRALAGPEIVRLEESAWRALEQGALGISTGLMYQPIYYADTAELVALGRVAAKSNTILTFHMRDYTTNLMRALEEVCDVAKVSGAKVHVSHLRAGGRSNRGKPAKAIEFIEAERRDGIDVGFDDYPYTAGASLLSQVLPQWLIEGGINKALDRLRDHSLRSKARDELNEPGSILNEAGPESIFVLGVLTKGNKRYEGMTIADISVNLKLDPAETMLRLYEKEQGHISVAADWFDQTDVDTVTEHPLSAIISDGIHTEGKPHPRLFGAFPKFLKDHAIDGPLSLEEAVRKITSAPALRLGLRKVGVIEEGYQADLTIFDPKRLRDTATYSNPTSRAEGVSHVLVNGRVVLKDGKVTGARPGRIISR
jgi:N-acyl-D-amino-acid deacylase